QAGHRRQRLVRSRSVAGRPRRRQAKRSAQGNPLHPHNPERVAMNSPFALPQASPWRRAGSCAALASLLLAFQPSLLLAQVQMNDPDRVPTTKAKPPPPASAPAPAKKTSRQTPTDNVSDDLN